MEKFRDWIYRFSQMVEIAIAVLIGLMIFVVLVKTCVFSFSSLAAAKADYVEVFTEFLSIVLELVIGIEFIRVLCRHSVKALLDVCHCKRNDRGTSGDVADLCGSGCNCAALCSKKVFVGRKRSGRCQRGAALAKMRRLSD